MAAASNYLENALLNLVLRGVAYTSPTDLYVALYTTDPTDADSGTEVSGGSYARVKVLFNAPVDIGGEAVCANTATIEFPEATNSWGTVTHIGIRDSLTVGNLLYHGVLQTPKSIDAGDVFRFLAGDIKIGMN